MELMDIRTMFTPSLIATLIKMTMTVMMTNLLIASTPISFNKIPVMDDLFTKLILLTRFTRC